MNDDRSARLALPLLQPSQAQKEMFHNEALALLDIAVQPVARSVGEAAPPSTPQVGQCWIVGSAPTGEWAGHALALAGFTAGGWRFVSPFQGFAVWSIADGCLATFEGSAWSIGKVAGSALVIGGVRVVGAQASAIPEPIGGGLVDAEARSTVAAILAALRTHGLIAA